MTPLSEKTASKDMKSVLVVDDMEANRAVLSRRLERLGYEVVSVSSGPAALEHVATSPPDIILLDFMMPEMNGIEVLRELRGSSATRDIPVIMVTARAESEATIEALGAGADDYVTKPIDFDVLSARIRTHLCKRSKATNLLRANAALDERVTVRSMALADLEGELTSEISRRKQLEQELARLTSPGRSDPELTNPCLSREQIEPLIAKFEAIFSAALEGRAANLAQLADFKASLERCRPKATS